MATLPGTLIGVQEVGRLCEASWSDDDFVIACKKLAEHIVGVGIICGKALVSGYRLAICKPNKEEQKDVGVERDPTTAHGRVPSS